MPQPGCVYPGGLDETEIQRIASEARPEWHSLRWHQKAVPTDTIWLTRRIFVEIQWDLKVSWQGLAWEQDGTNYQFLENIQPYVELTEASQSLSLDVSGSFGRPNLYNGIATSPSTSTSS